MGFAGFMFVCLTDLIPFYRLVQHAGGMVTEL